MDETESEEVFIQFTAAEADYYSAMAYELVLTGLSMLIGLGRKQRIHDSELAKMQAHFQEYGARLQVLKAVRDKMDEFEKQVVEGNIGYG